MVRVNQRYPSCWFAPGTRDSLSVMSSYEPELVGGHPALDFANSVSDLTVASPREYLRDLGDAARFGFAAGILTAEESVALVSVAESVGEEVRELRRLHAMRAVIQRTLVAILHRTDHVPADLCELDRAFADAARESVLTPSADGALTRRIDIDSSGHATLRHRLVTAAVELFTSPVRLERLGACPACGWFYLDGTRNRSRRWCSMSMCGGAAKSRRYYERVRGVGSEGV